MKNAKGKWERSKIHRFYNKMIEFLSKIFHGVSYLIDDEKWSKIFLYAPYIFV